ncbi:unnamed protein product, partial [Polarella glacialis]
LVNAFAVGLPTVLWNEQGFLDVVAGSNYPAVANSVEDALYWVSELVSNSSLRVALREQGLRLAEPYALDSLSQRLALILADVVSRPRKGKTPEA